jgi:hypothetical protein
MNAAGWPMDELVVGGQLTSNGKVRNGLFAAKKILNNGFGPSCCVDSPIYLIRSSVIGAWRKRLPVKDGDEGNLTDGARRAENAAHQIQPPALAKSWSTSMRRA